MIQIFFLGSSTIYGVGGENGGYADLIKQQLHKRMYSEGGMGERYEIFNFGKAGATIDFVLDTFPSQLEQYGRGGKTIVVFNVGGNNEKAENTPDNFVSTKEEYSAEMKELLEMLKGKCSHVIAVGGGYYDESKTNPKSNPLTGGKSYFSNARSRSFQKEFNRMCNEKEIPFIEVDASKDFWLENYTYVDGLHANSSGHEYMASKILDMLESLL